jgi:hypothetical protein
MKTTKILSLALGIFLAVPATSKPLDPHKTVHVRHSTQTLLFNSRANALAPKTPYSHHETDGLSRNSEDCNYGCIDH